MIASIIILASIMALLFSTVLLWRLIPDRLVDWYSKFDRRADVGISMFCLFSLSFIWFIILLSTIKCGAILIDATMFNEGLLETIVIGLIIIIVYVHTLIQFCVVNRRRTK